MKNDIKRCGNMIGGRQGWAYVCNSMRFAVLVADKDMPQKYDECKRYSKVRVVKQYKDGKELAVTGTLKCVDGKWSIGGSGCGIYADFTYADAKELVTGANTPVIRKDDIVAIAQYSDNSHFISLMLYKVGAIDINCTRICDLIELTDEEMEQVMKDADRWCDR